MNLTTLANAEAWLGLTSDNGGPIDKSVSRMIAATSSAILAFLDRSSLASRNFTEYRDGTGTRQILLRQWPVTSISSLILGDLSVAAGIAPAAGSGFLTPGFLFEPWDGVPPGRQCQLDLRGYGYGYALQNIGINYTAGYLTEGEAWSIPANPGPYTVTTLGPNGSWASDSGVVYQSTGLALLPVTGSPSQGQYNVNPITGVYTFSASDAGVEVLISYGYIPAVIEQACLEGVQLTAANQNQDPTLKSEKYDGVAFSYNTTGFVSGVNLGNVLLTANITSLLQPYRRVMRSA